MEYRYTRHQVARGSRPDAVRNDAFFLLKNVSSLRLTYQIRLLTYLAEDSGRKLIIRVPVTCEFHETLRAFQNEHSGTLRFEKVS